MTHKNAKYFSDEDYYYMVKDEITTTKYLIHSQINAKGFVEKPDVVGAIFGQTEGLLSDSLDLRVRAEDFPASTPPSAPNPY